MLSYKKELCIIGATEANRSFIVISSIRLVLATVLSLGFGCPVAMAGSLEPLAADTRNALQAIGVVRAGGRETVSICTGTLVAEDLVVTSAHCLENNRGLLQRVEFLAGLSGSRSVARSGVIDVRRHPIWTPDSGVGNYRYDVAILRLSQPIRSELVPPIRLLPNEEALPEEGALVGYPDVDIKKLHGRFDCELIPMRSAGIISSDCRAMRGNSGGPVLAETESGWTLAAVIVAGVRHNGTSIVAEVDDWLRKHVKDALRRETKRSAKLD